MRKRAATGPVLALAALLAGCGTVRSFEVFPEGSHYVYSGVRHDVSPPRGEAAREEDSSGAAAEDPAADSALALFDLPFSFLLDTLLLPGTAIHALVRGKPADADADEAPGHATVAVASLVSADGRTLVLPRDAVVDADDVRRLARFPGLTRLEVRGRPFGDDVFEEVSSLRELETLALPHTRAGDATLARARALPALRALDVSATRVTEAGLATLAAHPTLESLALGGALSGSLAFVGTIPRLATLDLSAAQVGSASFASLAALERPPGLRLRRDQIAAAGAQPRVRALALAECAREGSLDDLAAWRSLETLTLEETEGDPTLGALSALSALAELRLVGYAWTEGHARRLAALPRLRRLALRDANVRDLACLEGLASLESLTLRGEWYDDEILERLPELPALAELDLRETRATAACLPRLRRQPRLVSIRLPG